ncbi:hypothetical protein FHR56_000467 [Xanthomonas sacchari]|uniref:DUF4231 domain-containing protein n=1 Tax=unclassified Xanthomonas TaxID=2643310 RepID=UPI001368BDCA|nr:MULTISPECIES: DUF4231 domain-containing protein [unclassified Xanthomonas]MBB6365354.1 hypothetical protein [Xanthomonas sp. F10]MXV32322.1 DUF4231 domain-containing protein [Xanthomonas sp. LMG 8989]
MRTEDFPALYRSADDLAARQQRLFFLLLRCNLVFLVLGAALSFGSVDHWLIALLQALTLLAALAFSVALYTIRAERVWYAARALAESTKTLTWRFISRAEPFDDADEDSERSLQSRLAATLRQNRELAGRFQSDLEARQITECMRSLRSDDLEKRIATYRLHRISNQRTWYASKAKENSSRSRACFTIVVVANTFAVASALLKIKFPDFKYWPTDVLVAIASGALAYLQSKRYSELAASYALTAHEIGVVEEQLAQVKGEREFSLFVGDAENAFSREHTQWEARKDI